MPSVLTWTSDPARAQYSDDVNTDISFGTAPSRCAFASKPASSNGGMSTGWSTLSTEFPASPGAANRCSKLPRPAPAATIIIPSNTGRDCSSFTKPRYSSERR